MDFKVGRYPEDIEKGRLSHQADILEKCHFGYGSDRRLDELLDVVEPHVYTARLVKEWVGDVNLVFVTKIG